MGNAHFTQAERLTGELPVGRKGGAATNSDEDRRAPALRLRAPMAVPKASGAKAMPTAALKAAAPSIAEPENAKPTSADIAAPPPEWLISGAQPRALEMKTAVEAQVLQTEFEPP
jgi:hypothetical protein